MLRELQERTWANLADGKYSDFSIILDGAIVIDTHKCIMLEVGSDDIRRSIISGHNEYIITGVPLDSSQLFEEVIHCIYSGKLECYDVDLEEIRGIIRYYFPGISLPDGDPIFHAIDREERDIKESLKVKDVVSTSHGTPRAVD